MRILINSLVLLPLLAKAQECGPDGAISIAGSSTVLPIAQKWAEAYGANCSGVTVSVESGGSSNGAGRVCGEEARGTPVDIGNMSRDWKDSEASRMADGYTLQCLVGDTSRKAVQVDVSWKYKIPFPLCRHKCH